MGKTLLNRIPNETPQDIRYFVSAANIYDSSCPPEAKVYFIDRGKDTIKKVPPSERGHYMFYVMRQKVCPDQRRRMFIERFLYAD